MHRVSACGSGWEEENGPPPHVWQIPAGFWQRSRIFWGQEEDAKYYRKLSQETGEAYREILMKADCTVKKEFQTAYVLPLYYQMLSGEDKKKTAAIWRVW